MNQKQKTTKFLPVGAAVLISILFVFMGVWARELKESFTIFQQVYMRVLMAGLVALIVFKPKFNGLFSGISKRDWGVYVARALTYYLVGVTMGAVAVQNTNLSTVGFISSLPILGVIAWVMFKEKVPLKSIPFILLSIVGLGFVVGLNFSDLKLGVGELAAIASMLGFNVGYMLSRMHGKNKNNFENTTILLLISWIPVFLIAVIARQPLWPSSVTTKSLVILIVAALLNVVIIYLINYLFNNLKAYFAGNILLLESVFAIIIGYILYSEKPTFGALIGGAIIIGCALAINKIESRIKS